MRYFDSDARRSDGLPPTAMDEESTLDKESTVSLDRFVAPLGGQDVELLEVRYLSGGVPLLRVRIREKSRFTVFEIDALTAARWATVMGAWARGQGAA